MKRIIDVDDSIRRMFAKGQFTKELYCAIDKVIYKYAKDVAKGQVISITPIKIVCIVLNIPKSKAMKTVNGGFLAEINYRLRQYVEHNLSVPWRNRRYK